MHSFDSVNEALEFYVKKYPHIPKILIESAIEYDMLEQRKITEHLKILSDDNLRSNKTKERLKKKILDKPKMVIEEISKVVEFK